MLEHRDHVKSYYLFEDKQNPGANTIACHMYYADIKIDWLSKLFLRANPEFEYVISTYPTFIYNRGVRTLFGLLS